MKVDAEEYNKLYKSMVKRPVVNSLVVVFIITITATVLMWNEEHIAVTILVSLVCGLVIGLPLLIFIIALYWFLGSSARKKKTTDESKNQRNNP